MYNKVHIGKMGLTQDDALSPLLSIFSLEYAIRKVQENQLLFHADNINMVSKNAEALLEANGETARNKCT
jgi:hypothetical protein